MKIISFDPSIVNTGYAVLDGSKLLEHGVISIPRPVEDEGALAWRLAYLMAEVEKLINAHQPGRGVVEKPPSFSYSRSTDKARAKGLNYEDIQKNASATAVIMATLSRNGIPVTEKFAHQWKTDRGRGMDKARMINLARNLFPALKSKKLSDHEAEAICLAVLI